VTGAAGFFGRCLAQLLRSAGKKLVLVDRLSGAETAAGKCIYCDLGNRARTRKLLRDSAPSEIYHLAGVFSADYAGNYKGNFLPAKNILDSVLALKLKCRVLLVGSAAEYGAPLKNPVAETAPLTPVTYYGFAKMLQTRLGEFYHRVYGADIVTARVFNLAGPGVSDTLFPGRVSRQIEAYKRGETSCIKVGRLDSWRDYLMVQEAAAALRVVMDHGRTGEVYNVGSGVPLRMGTLLARMLGEAGVPLSAVESAPQGGMRPDVYRIYADIAKLLALKTAEAESRRI